MNTSQDINQTQTSRPKVGLALSGASSRSVFYIGFLEVLKENDFPVDHIAALSGATIVAASYACGTMPKLKDLALRINKEIVFNLIERSKGNGGLYHLGKLEETLRIYTKNKNFEDVSPRLSFIATDLVAGEEVVLQVGDLSRAICASCTLPVVFSPQPWGNKLLVDGGVVNIVPGQVARDAGSDFVIGVDLRTTRHVFSPWQILARKIVNKVRALFWPQPARQLFDRLTEKIQDSDFWQSLFENNEYTSKLKDPRLLTVIGRSLDIAIDAQEKQRGQKNYGCDLLITRDLKLPFWKRNVLLRFTNVDNTGDFYQEGRRTAEEYLPKMWQMLKDKQNEQDGKHRQLEQLFNNHETRTR